MYRQEGGKSLRDRPSIGLFDTDVYLHFLLQNMCLLKVT